MNVPTLNIVKKKSKMAFKKFLKLYFVIYYLQYIYYKTKISKN